MRRNKEEVGLLKKTAKLLRQASILLEETEDSRKMWGEINVF